MLGKCMDNIVTYRSFMIYLLLSISLSAGADETLSEFSTDQYYKEKVYMVRLCDLLKSFYDYDAKAKKMMESQVKVRYFDSPPYPKLGSYELNLKCPHPNFGYLRPMAYALSRLKEDLIYELIEEEEININAVFPYRFGERASESGTLLDWMDYWIKNMSVSPSDKARFKSYVESMTMNLWEDYGARKHCELNATCKCTIIEDPETFVCTEMGK